MNIIGLLKKQFANATIEYTVDYESFTSTTITRLNGKVLSEVQTHLEDTYVLFVRRMQEDGHI